MAKTIANILVVNRLNIKYICYMRPSKQVVPEAVRAELVRIGELLKAARVARGLSQAEVAKRLRVSIPTIQAIEKGAFGSAVGTLLGVMWMLGLSLPSKYVEQQ